MLFALVLGCALLAALCYAIATLIFLNERWASFAEPVSQALGQEASSIDKPAAIQSGQAGAGAAAIVDAAASAAQALPPDVKLSPAAILKKRWQVAPDVAKELGA